MDGVQLSQGYRATMGSWYLFNRPWKDERLGRPWSHPVVLIQGPLDWESSALTTRPLPYDTAQFSAKLRDLHYMNQITTSKSNRKELILSKKGHFLLDFWLF